MQSNTGKHTGFTEIITAALLYSDLGSNPDYKRFNAAIQDLANDYPEEKKFLGQNLDAPLFNMCLKATDVEVQGIEAISKNAADYIHRERKVDSVWAKYICDQLVYAIWNYSHPNEPHVKVKSGKETEEPSEKQRNRFYGGYRVKGGYRVEGGYRAEDGMQAENEESEGKSELEKEKTTAGEEQELASGKRRRSKKKIALIVVAIICGALILCWVLSAASITVPRSLSGI